MSRGTFGRMQSGSFHMEALKSGRKDASETMITVVSRNESQEWIFEGITVTKDVKVTRT